MPDYGPATLEQILTDLQFEYNFLPLTTSPSPLPFTFRFGKHGTIIETEYPGHHRILPELHLAEPCFTCSARTVYTDEAGSRCAKCGTGYRP